MSMAEMQEDFDSYDVTWVGSCLTMGVLNVGRATACSAVLGICS